MRLAKDAKYDTKGSFQYLQNKRKGKGINGTVKIGKKKVSDNKETAELPEIRENLSRTSLALLKLLPIFYGVISLENCHNVMDIMHLDFHKVFDKRLLTF